METIDYETEAREVGALCLVFYRAAVRRPEFMEDLPGYVGRLDDESWKMATAIANQKAKARAERTGEKFVEMHTPSPETRRLVIEALKRGKELGL